MRVTSPSVWSVTVMSPTVTVSWLMKPLQFRVGLAWRLVELEFRSGVGCVLGGFVLGLALESWVIQPLERGVR